MLSVFEHAGFVLTRALDGGVVEVAFPIAATEGYRTRVDERDHVAVTASLRPVLRARTVAVIGASARRDRSADPVPQHPRRRLHRCRVPRQPRGEPVAGVRAYTSIEEHPRRRSTSA